MLGGKAGDLLLDATASRQEEELLQLGPGKAQEFLVANAHMLGPIVGIVGGIDGGADGVEVGFEEGGDDQALEAGAVLLFLIGPVVVGIEAHMEDHAVVFKILVMAVACPIDGVEVDFHVALEDLSGQGDAGIEEVGATGGVPSAGLDDLHGLATGGGQRVEAKEPLVPDGLDETLIQAGRRSHGGGRLAHAPATAQQVGNLAVGLTPAFLGFCGGDQQVHGVIRLLVPLTAGRGARSLVVKRGPLGAKCGGNGDHAPAPIGEEASPGGNGCEGKRRRAPRHPGAHLENLATRWITMIS